MTHSGLGLWIDQVVVALRLHRLHEFLGYTYANIEIGNVGIVRFAVDEVQDIRMVYPQHAHVGAAACAALLDCFSSRIEDLHEADRPAGNSAGRPYRRAALAQSWEWKPCAATRFVYEGCIFYRIEYTLHAVLYRQHKTCWQLSKLPPGIHQSRRIRHEPKTRHQLKKIFWQFCSIDRIVVTGISLRYGVSNSSEHFFDRFDDLAVLIFSLVAFLQYFQRIFTNITDRHFLNPFTT